MKLSKKIINGILDIGFYFDDEFDHNRKEIIISDDTKQWFKNNLELQLLNSAFVEFYSFAIGGCGYQGEELFTLEQILEHYKSQSWLNLFPEDKLLKQKYPFAGKRYIQISSIEGAGSYFYDKQTDCVYDVNWGDEEAMIIGELQPWFTSFYDFLEWYYSEDD